MDRFIGCCFGVVLSLMTNFNSSESLVPDLSLTWQLQKPQIRKQTVLITTQTVETTKVRRQNLFKMKVSICKYTQARIERWVNEGSIKNPIVCKHLRWLKISFTFKAEVLGSRQHLHLTFRLTQHLMYQENKVYHKF